MEVKHLHPWHLTSPEAKNIQETLAKKVIREDTSLNISTVCGVDVGFGKEGKAHAACVVMSYPVLEVIDYITVNTTVDFPYIPGLLSFREIPSFIPALERLKIEPDLILCDGHGIAHPRRFGIASHLGLLLDKPVVGCAKSKLIGTYHEPDNKRGSYEYLYHSGEIIGAVMRTRSGVKPVFISIGHKLSLKRALDLILHCCTKYRIPEPIRCAHMKASDGVK